MKNPRVFRDCKICNSVIMDYKWKNHFKIHGLTYRQYYDTHLKTSQDGICFCGKSTNWSEQYSGYNQFCSFSCSTKHKHQTNSSELTKGIVYYIKNTPDHMEKVHAKHPHLGPNLGKYVKEHPEVSSLGGKTALNKFNKFRCAHKGMPPTEWFFFNHSYVQELYSNNLLVPLDKRFWKIPKGGGSEGVVMDFSIPRAKLCIELDGTLFNKHSPEINSKRDKWLLDTHGWRTIRFTNDEVVTDIESVVSKIKEEMKNK